MGNPTSRFLAHPSVNPPYVAEDRLPSHADHCTPQWVGSTLAARIFLWYARRVPNHPMKLRITRWLLRAFFRSGLGLLGPFGARLNLDAAGVDYISHHLIFEGIWEPMSLTLSMSIMKDGGTFLDVGSHLGIYTCALGRAQGVVCISVEACPDRLLELKRNTRLSQITGLHIVHLAAGEFPAVVDFGLRSPSNSGTGRVSSKSAGLDENIVVASARLDDILSHLRSGPLKLLKIDVEGQELGVLKGLSLTGRHRPENIIIELEDELLAEAGTSPKELLAFLEAAGYDAQTVEGVAYTLDDGVPPPENNLWFVARANPFPS